MGAGWARRLAERPGRAAPLLLVLLTGTAAGVSGLQGLEMWNEQRGRREALRAEVQRLEKEAAGLLQEIARLRSDPQALPLFAKTHHQLVEPGEVVALLRFPERYGPPRPALPERSAPGYSIR